MITIKDICMFASGCLIGAAASSLYFKKKYETIANEEISSMKEHLKKKEEDKKEEEPKNYKTLESDSIAKSLYFSTDSDEVVEYSNYNKERVEELKNKEHPEDDIPENPFRISAEDFLNDPEYDKETLTFYDEDAALVDEDEHVSEISNTIGQDAYSYFVESSIDEMFVRNPNLGIDFEVVRVLGSYFETITGGSSD